MNITGKNGPVLPESYGKLENIIQRLLIAKVAEERFEHWGYLSFSEAISQIISLSLISKVGEN